MSHRDYYDILKVSKTATESEIKQAYHRLARMYHPDVSKASDAEQRFKEVSEAYQVLSDKQKRHLYDNYGKSGVDGQHASGFGGFEDIFSDFFGGGKRSQRREGQAKKGVPIKAEAQISLKELMHGTKVKFKANLTKNCQQCHGFGALTENIKTCHTCQGTGIITATRRTPFGIIQQEISCHNCRGQGKIITKKCLECNGHRQYQAWEMITINLPKSINIANEILVPGIGNDGLNGGPRGDLILRVTLKSNPFYSKNNHDLHIELEVSYLTALLGGEIVVPSFDGDLKVKISALTKNQSQLRIAKKGFYLSPKSNRRGDLIVTIGIAIPNRILSQSKKHLTAVAQTDPVAIDLNRYHNQQ